jgi:hypothetical protein
MTPRVDRCAAYLRGGFVASFSGAMSIAAHGAGGGVLHLSVASLLLLVLAVSAVGAVAGSLRSHSPLLLATLLTLGQLVGHFALTVSTGHHHGPGLTTQMLAAHIVGAAAAALLIRTAERLCHAVSRTVRHLVVVLLAPPRDSGLTAPLPVTPSAALPQWALWRSSGTRAPPAFAL